jgi:uncharacterized protein (UPF0262 family)
LCFAVDVFSVVKLTIDCPKRAENLGLELFSLCLTHAVLKGITTYCQETYTSVRMRCPNSIERVDGGYDRLLGSRRLATNMR